MVGGPFRNLLTENKINVIENESGHKESWLTGTAKEETGARRYLF